MDSTCNVGRSAPVSESGSVPAARDVMPTPPQATLSRSFEDRELPFHALLSLAREGRSTALQPETEVVTTAVTFTSDPEVSVKALGPATARPVDPDVPMLLYCIPWKSMDSSSPSSPA